mmetsp:Transcript_1491/g.3339  ORF Transcript_1491/g.3339 Transcript_1491/m.3339 type:complete len:105 (+) Transcript_1491:74-388(+)
MELLVAKRTDALSHRITQAREELYGRRKTKMNALLDSDSFYFILTATVAIQSTWSDLELLVIWPRMPSYCCIVRNKNANISIFSAFFISKLEEFFKVNWQLHYT